MTRVTPAYDDVPEERYHFPRTYLRQVEATVGDWIVYYEPRRSGDGSASGGRQAYFAIARVTRIAPDARLEDHFYAYVTDFLTLSRPVPFKSADGLFMESSLKREDGETNKGAFGRAVRTMAEFEFDAIARLGFSDELPIAPRIAEQQPLVGFDDSPQSPFVRPIIEQVIARPFRDVAFRHQVRDAYDKTCAITGLRLINGGGRPEVQAAHIQAVEDSGPDSVRNGLALSGTIHWLFDRGLVAIDSDYRLLAPARLVPEELRPLVRHGTQVRLPREQNLWPHQRFLEHHRNNRFKG